MINLTRHSEQIKKNAQHCKKHNIILPTFKQMKDPTNIPSSIQNELKSIGLWDIHPRNLFRITWKNEPKASNGLFGELNTLTFDSSITGVPAKIVGLCGKWFPTGAHKVGATYGCLAPRLITGQFNPLKSKAVWPSTGNYCRGGAYISSLLACQSIAILPEEMSKERFEWLKKTAGEVIATPGCESNVKEIFDKCWELRKTRDDIMIFNQFEEFGNVLWHHEITGSAFLEYAQKNLKPTDRLAGLVLSSGSAGTLGSSYPLKKQYPQLKLAVAEALQCPTLLNNGFGGHRIEGIGDKHVPWIHDAKNTDMVIAVDDEDTLRILRLFNEKLGVDILKDNQVCSSITDKLNYLGISGIGNLIAAIKFAKYYELKENDYVFTLFTDSLELYGSRLQELTQQRGNYSSIQAHKDFDHLHHIGIDHMLELGYYDKKRIHNLKYFTWIEQQEKNLNELNQQWHDHENYWKPLENLAAQIDELIIEFNQHVNAENR